MTNKVVYKIIISLVLFGSLFYLSDYIEKNKVGSNKVTFKQIKADEVLRLDKNADIFQWNRIIYKSNIDWVSQFNLSKKDFLGEVIGNSKKVFKDGIANKLPVGTKIYSSKERKDVLIIDYDGTVKYYLAQEEG